MSDLMDVDQVAELLGINPQTVRKWAAKGKLPAIKLGGRTVRFRRDEIEAWIEAQRVRPEDLSSSERAP